MRTVLATRATRASTAVRGARPRIGKQASTAVRDPCPRIGKRNLRRSGFTLIEVLIALAILAVGLLGGVALLIDGLRAGRSALLQTNAALLATDLADRIRANRAGGAAYELSEGDAVAAPAKACAAIAECSSVDVAQRDLYAWQQSVLEQLPGGSTSVGVEPVAETGAHLFRIVIRWAETGDRSRSALAIAVQA
jgi:type IV pilus assembly protein PilV